MGEPLSVVDILTAAGRFDGHLVTVVGFYVGEREHHAVYSSREDVGESSRAVWLRHEDTVGGCLRARQLNRSWIRLVGIFHNCRNSGAGHFNAFPALIGGITEFEAAEQLMG
jgi:hypothetical protein